MSVDQQTDTTPDVPLPSGAVPPADPVQEWMEYDGDKVRIIHGEKHEVVSSAAPDIEVSVEASAVQLVDGSIQPRGDNPGIESGPTVSIQSHWEAYLTAAEARQVARYIEEAASTIEQWSGPPRHVCGFDWCDVSWRNEAEHWCLTYTTASLRASDPYHITGDHDPHKVGVGITYDEGTIPAICVHLDGGQRDDDHDAFLKIQEAIALRDLLDRAISGATQAFAHYVENAVPGLSPGTSKAAQ